MSKKYTLICLFLLLLNGFSCSPDKTRMDDLEFNKTASNFFLASVDSINLSPLSRFDACALREIVAKDLDKLNNWNTYIVHNEFYVRSYYDVFLQLHFSFVHAANDDRFYFLGIPHLDDYIYEPEKYYIPKSDTTLTLKDSVSLVELNTPLLEDFFRSSFFEIRDKQEFNEKLKVADHLLSKSFEFISMNEISIGSFTNRIDGLGNLGQLPRTTVDNINRLVDPMFNSDFYFVKSSFFESSGYVLMVYSWTGVESENLNLKVYFIPNLERNKTLKNDTNRAFENCVG